jgi:hypothetical protein
MFIIITSYTIATAVGFVDREMTLETNLPATQAIAPVAKEYSLSLTIN